MTPEDEAAQRMSVFLAGCLAALPDERRAELEMFAQFEAEVRGTGLSGATAVPDYVRRR